jgi:hypothetical protein
MDFNTPSSKVSQPIEFSLTHGGPFYRWMCKAKLIRSDSRDLLRLSLACIAVGWLPVAISTLFDDTPNVLANAWVLHARYLVAIPLFFVAEEVLERRSRSAIASIREGDFVPGATFLGEVTRTAERLRDSVFVELTLAIFVIASRIGIWQLTGRAELIPDYYGVGATNVASLWYSFVSLPLFSWLTLRWLWRWLIWASVLWRLSRVPLRLVPTHPDHTGGIGLLAEPINGVAVFLIGVSCVLAAGWGSDIVFAKAAPASFTTQFVTFIAVGEVLALAPLEPFFGILRRAQHRGNEQYSGFATAYTRSFHERWIEGTNRGDLLGTPDIQSLADLIHSVECVESMRATVFSREHGVKVLLALCVPMLPLFLIASRLPLNEILKRLISSLLLGG